MVVAPRVIVVEAAPKFKANQVRPFDASTMPFMIRYCVTAMLGLDRWCFVHRFRG